MDTTSAERQVKELLAIQTTIHQLNPIVRSKLTLLTTLRFTHEVNVQQFNLLLDACVQDRDELMLSQHLARMLPGLGAKQKADRVACAKRRITALEQTTREESTDVDSEGYTKTLARLHCEFADALVSKPLAYECPVLAHLVQLADTSGGEVPEATADAPSPTRPGQSQAPKRKQDDCQKEKRTKGRLETQSGVLEAPNAPITIDAAPAAPPPAATDSPRPRDDGADKDKDVVVEKEAKAAQREREPVGQLADKRHEQLKLVAQMTAGMPDSVGALVHVALRDLIESIVRTKRANKSFGWMRATGFSDSMAKSCSLERPLSRLHLAHGADWFGSIAHSYTRGVNTLLERIAALLQTTDAVAQLRLAFVFARSDTIGQGMARLLVMVAAALAARFRVEHYETLGGIDLYAMTSDAVARGPIASMRALEKGLCLLREWLQDLGGEKHWTRPAVALLGFLHKSGAVPEKLMYYQGFSDEPVLCWRKNNTPLSFTGGAYLVADALLYDGAVQMPIDDAATKALATVVKHMEERAQVARRTVAATTHANVLKRLEAYTEEAPGQYGQHQLPELCLQGVGAAERQAMKAALEVAVKMGEMPAGNHRRNIPLFVDEVKHMYAATSTKKLARVVRTVALTSDSDLAAFNHLWKWARGNACQSLFVGTVARRIRDCRVEAANGACTLGKTLDVHMSAFAFTAEVHTLLDSAGVLEDDVVRLVSVVDPALHEGAVDALQQLKAWAEGRGFLAIAAQARAHMRAMAEAEAATCAIMRTAMRGVAERAIEEDVAAQAEWDAEVRAHTTVKA